MSIKEDAAVKLNEAYEAALITPHPVCRHGEFIDYVIDNTHLTFKYILFTAVLAKATDSSINPLCLQKKSGKRQTTPRMDRHETMVTGRCETFRYCHIWR